MSCKSPDKRKISQSEVKPSIHLSINRSVNQSINQSIIKLRLISEIDKKINHYETLKNIKERGGVAGVKVAPLSTPANIRAQLTEHFN